MLININLKRNLKNKIACKNYVFNKLHACSHRVLIKRVIILLKLLHEDLMSLILKVKNLFIVYNKALYVFTLLNDAI